VTRFLSPALTVALLAGLCMAQSSDRITAFAGYSHIDQDFSLNSPNGLTGWNASASFRLAQHVGVVADFAGYYPGYNAGCMGCGQSAKVHTLLFGPQVTFTKGRIAPFARFLMGDSRVTTSADFVTGGNLNTFTSSNSFTFGAGGGVDYRLTRRIALRGQLDWLHTGFQTSDNQRSYELIPNVVRVSTGIVFRF
jgi:opacity protein-like surface antigen